MIEAKMIPGLGGYITDGNGLPDGVTADEMFKQCVRAMGQFNDEELLAMDETITNTKAVKSRSKKPTAKTLGRLLKQCAQEP